MHTDETLMPADREAWGTLNLAEYSGMDAVQLTMWMNRYYAHEFKEDVFTTWGLLITVAPTFELDQQENCRIRFSSFKAAKVAVMEMEIVLHDRYQCQIFAHRERCTRF